MFCRFRGIKQIEDSHTATGLVILEQLEKNKIKKKIKGKKTVKEKKTKRRK